MHFGEFFHALCNTFLNGSISCMFQRFSDEASNFFGGNFREATCRNGGSSNANAGWIHWAARIKRQHIFVYRNANFFESDLRFFAAYAPWRNVDE